MNIILTTLTIFAAGYMTAYILYFALLCFAFLQLTPQQQLVAKINLGPVPFFGFLLSASFLLARVIT